jgi:hypothetical protein
LLERFPASRICEARYRAVLKALNAQKTRSSTTPPGVNSTALLLASRRF